jgi:hypothetical protein
MKTMRKKIKHIPRNNSYEGSWIIDEYNMCVRGDYAPEDRGYGDALGRTAIAYLVWGGAKLRRGFLNCFKEHLEEGKFFIKPIRHPEFEGVRECSRDHIIVGTAVSAIMNDAKTVRILADNIKRKFSNLKFAGRMTLDMRLWMKGLFKSDFKLNLAMLLLGSSWRLYNGWNRLLRFVGNYKKYDIYEVSSIKANKFQKFLNKLMIPEFSRYHGALMIFSTPDRIKLKRFAQKSLLADTQGDNYVIRGLLGDKVDWAFALDKYPGIKGFRWTRRLDESINFYYKVGKDEFNNLDIDFLKWFKVNGF